MARLCPTCGHENADDDDFCGSCGAFLRWDPTQEVQAVTHIDHQGFAALDQGFGVLRADSQHRTVRRGEHILH